MDLMDKYSADSFRFLMMSSPLTNGEDFALADKDVADAARKLSMIWNVYDFFTLYAEVDGWEWNGIIDDPSTECQNVLDIWILSKVHTLITDVNRATEEYDLQSASRLIVPFIDELSNWYVRRSRKRFWKSDDDADKALAYKTLHYVLVQLSHVIAPFTPFLAEELYRNLTGGESVHLRDWPVVGVINEKVVREMDTLRTVVNEGLSQRAKTQMKVRQPLQKISITGMGDLGADAKLYLDILKEEVNVKEVLWSDGDVQSVELDITLTDDLKREGLARELVRLVQSARKEAGLEVDDRINLSFITDSKELNEAIGQYGDYIRTETLAVDLTSEKLDNYNVEQKIIGQSIKISLNKSAL
jgi:isoleucyl-tRNA synthetase